MTSKKWVIRVVANAATGSEVNGVLYIKDINVDAHDGRGSMDVTAETYHAVQFDSPGAAFQYWMRQSKTRPIRADGKPNRPGTAYTIEVITTAEARDLYQHR